jgi:tRNA (guanine-N7-)-methyltransferase
MLTIEDILIEPPGDEEVVYPMAWFATPGPFELEIGCGKGGFLLSRARAHPEIRLLGIELRRKHAHYCADRLRRWQITNARVMRTDAAVFVARHLPRECVSVLHLYHPDPWPKKRHHKRRLIQPGFIEAAVRALQPGGRWLMQSDHEEYFQIIQTLLGGHPQLRGIPWESAAADPGPEWSGTNFEVKYSGRGHVIHRVVYERV